MRRFPARNRIVAGLAAVTIVVEAREGSGALITADFALEEGREVLAVPGEITSALAAGSNGLLRVGATPLTRAEDVLELFGIEMARPEAPAVSATARAVLERVQEEPRGADAIGRATGLDAGEVAAALAELELAGLVAESAGVYRGVRPAG
jgi:DNA processing protein